MEARPELFHKLLGILTPEVINKLTTISLGENKQSLTELIFNSEIVNAKVVLDNVVSIEEFQKKKPDEAAVPTSDAAAESSDEAPVEGVTATIIDVKKRLKEAQLKMKEAEIYCSYKTNSLIDLNQSRKNREDMNKSSNLGVLVNKKQA